jgi:hypothetical protein
MQKFLYLEGGYLILAVTILFVTLFVTTRPFMGGNVKRKGLVSVSIVLALMIGGHFLVTSKRMEEVKQAFENGDEIICESRLVRKGAQSFILKKSLGWRLEGDCFVSEAFIRPFFTARCIVYKKTSRK